MPQSPQWQNRIVRYAMEDPEQLLAHPMNARIHPKAQQDGLGAALDTLGIIAPVIISTKTQHCIDGHLRIQMAISKGQTAIPVVYVDLSEEEEAIALLSHDFITSLAVYDRDLVQELYDQIETDNQQLQTLLDGLASQVGVIEPPDEIPPDDHELFTRDDVPDALWPTNNDYEIPMLDLSMQADAFDLPFSIWGNLRRSATMKGTWAFYTEDYRYEALWTDPSPVLNSQCINAIEPNFSCYSQMPLPVGLWAIYRKRWIARYWQSKGVRIFVDLNVNEKFYDINLMGVPVGWKAYATRGYSDRIASTDCEYTMACERAQTSSILFLVYGGGKAVKAHCMSKGYLWIDEVMNYG